MRIGELAGLTGCEVVTIRYFEKEGLLSAPARSGGNYRLYSKAHLEQLQFVLHCRTLDMTHAEIRALQGLRDNPTQDCSEVNALLDSHLQQVEERIAALLQLKQHMAALRKRCGGARPIESCGILQGLADCSSHTKVAGGVTGF